MNGEPTDLRKEQRRRLNKEWTPQEALEFALDDIKAGRINPGRVVICMEHVIDPADHESNVTPIHYASHMTNGDLIAHLEVQKCMAMQRWLGTLWTGVSLSPPPDETI